MTIIIHHRGRLIQETAMQNHSIENQWPFERQRCSEWFEAGSVNFSWD
jgi:hypothetical protein